MTTAISSLKSSGSVFTGVLKEPLFHFLALGMCLFIAYNAINPDSTDSNPNRIIVDRETLLTYMQYRAKAFDTERAQQQLDAMPQARRQNLIDDYIREEALFREAKALQLDRNDNVARQRLIQQMRYLTQSVITAGIELSDDELKSYQNEHAQRYTEPAKTTFTHVFINTEKRSVDEARKIAQRQLEHLNHKQVPFHKALGFGDRFLYHRNYVQKDAELIASHFGAGLQSAVFETGVRMILPQFLGHSN